MLAMKGVMSVGAAQTTGCSVMPEHRTGSGLRQWHPGLHLGVLGAFGFAVACVGVATALRLVLGLFMNEPIAYEVFYPAVVIASLVAGRASGAFALVLGGVMAWWAFQRPYFTIIVPTPDQMLDLCVYVLASTLIVLAVGRYRELTELVRTREAALEIELAEKARREDALQRANERNEVLLREIHHRVKNNLQIIVGLLSSHRRSVDNPEIRDLLSQFRGRVLAIARLYDRIQQVETFETVEFSALLRAICTDIMQSANAEGAIAFRSDRPAVVATNPAITLAIVTNELITNALKHANLGDKGPVEVRCEEDDAQVSIVVADNGPGLAPDSDFTTSPGFGMSMARRLVEGMGGALLVLPRAQGAAFELKVPRNKATRSGD